MIDKRDNSMAYSKGVVYRTVPVTPYPPLVGAVKQRIFIEVA